MFKLGEYLRPKSPSLTAVKTFLWDSNAQIAGMVLNRMVHKLALGSTDSTGGRLLNKL